MIIYGKQVCLYALTHHADEVERVFIAKKGILPEVLFRSFREKITFLEPKLAQSMSRGGNHQGILLEIKVPEQIPFSLMKEMSFLVVLDGLTDVGNIGAIVRTAYAMGVEGLVVSGGVSSLQLPGVIRASAGAMLDMPFAILPNIGDVLNELKQKGFGIYGAQMDGEPVSMATFKSKRVLVLGSEGSGLSKKAIRQLNKAVAVEMKRSFDSLNVSAAAAILLYRMSHAIE